MQSQTSIFKQDFESRYAIGIPESSKGPGNSWDAIKTVLIWVSWFGHKSLLDFMHLLQYDLFKDFMSSSILKLHMVEVCDDEWKEIPCGRCTSHPWHLYIVVCRGHVRIRLTFKLTWQHILGDSLQIPEILHSDQGEARRLDLSLRIFRETAAHICSLMS